MGGRRRSARRTARATRARGCRRPRPAARSPRPGAGDRPLERSRWAASRAARPSSTPRSSIASAMPGPRERADDEAAAAERLQQPLVGEGRERDAKRRSRYAEPLRERHLRHAVAGGELAFEDELSHPQRCLHSLRMPSGLRARLAFARHCERIQPERLCMQSAPDFGIQTHFLAINGELSACSLGYGNRRPNPRPRGQLGGDAALASASHRRAGRKWSSRLPGRKGQHIGRRVMPTVVAVETPLLGSVGEDDPEFDGSLPRQLQGCPAPRESEFSSFARETFGRGTQPDPASASQCDVDRASRIHQGSPGRPTFSRAS